jgi:chemotaxis protein histidine kinase CheA
MNSAGLDTEVANSYVSSESQPDSRPKPRVQIIEDPTAKAQGKIPRNEVTQGLRMRGNVLIQNPSLEWKVRTCELNGSFLTFFRKQKLVAAIDLEQVGDINVLRQIKDSSGQGFVFSLHLKEGRYFNVRVTMYEDATNWVKVLVDVRDKLRSHQSSRSRLSFSTAQGSQSSYTPTTADFNTSLVADEPDDNIKVYFDNEQYPPSPILQSNEKYIRPVQAKAPENSSALSSQGSVTGSVNSSFVMTRKKSGIPTPSSPKKGPPAIDALLAGLTDAEASQAAEVRKGVDTSPWRVPYDEIAPKLSPGGSIPGPLGSSRGGEFPSEGHGAPTSQTGLTLFDVDEGEVPNEAAEADEGEAEEQTGPVPMQLSSGSAEASPSRGNSPEDRTREEYLTAERVARERKLEADRARRAATEKMAADKVAEEERLRAAKAAREAKEATARAEREKKLLAERKEREARAAAEKAAEEERVAAEKAAKEAWMAAERAAREKKYLEDKAVRDRLAAEKAAQEEQQRLARAAVEEKERQERAARIAEREAIGRKKLAEAAAARAEAERAEKERLEEAARRKVQQRLAAVERSPQRQAMLQRQQQQDQQSPQRVQVQNEGLQPEYSQNSMHLDTGRPGLGESLMFTKSEDEYYSTDPWRLSRSFDHGSMSDNVLAGVEGVTMVESPRSSASSNFNRSPGPAEGEGRFSPPRLAPAGPATSGLSAGATTSSVQSGSINGDAKQTPPTSPSGLRFPLRKVSTMPSDPRASFYNADGSFKPFPKSPGLVPSSPAKVAASPSTAAKTATSAGKPPAHSVSFVSRGGSEASGSSDRSAVRAAQAAVEYSALTTENVATHKSNSSATPSPGTTSTTPPSQHTQPSVPSGRTLDSSGKESTPGISESSMENIPPGGGSSSAYRRTTTGGGVQSPPFPGDFHSPPNNPWSPGLSKAAAMRHTPSVSPSKRGPVARAVQSSNKYSSVFIFLTVACSAVLLVALLLGSVHYYNRHLAEEQWRTASLQHLQAINQNFRSVEDLTKPTMPTGPAQPTQPGAYTPVAPIPTSSRSRVSSSSGRGGSASTSSPFAQPTEPAHSTGARNALHRPSVVQARVTTTTTAVPPSAAGTSAPGVRVTALTTTDAYGNSLVRSNTIVKRFFRDLVRASARFIVTVFSKFARLFKK